jgi:glycine cleavage system H protein
MNSIRGFDFPDELHYLLEHDTWARLDADGNVTVGLTSLGAHISGEFIAFMPKPVGTMIERDRALGVLEMSKVIRSARSPVAGTIVDVNERLAKEPSLINASPCADGWLVRLRPSDWNADAVRLVTADALPEAIASYMQFLSETFDKS